MIKSSTRGEKINSAMLEEISFKLVNDLFIASRRNSTPSASSSPLTLSTTCSFFIHPDAKSKLCLMLSMLMLVLRLILLLLMSIIMMALLLALALALVVIAIALAMAMATTTTALTMLIRHMMMVLVDAATSTCCLVSV